MSHAATNWAIQQRGLKPATKIVLWHLADCHNPAHGCFPSQEYLSEHCEMSRSSLNEHLATLEQIGLIRREQRRDSRTRRQENTRYMLAFETGFTQKPSPDIGHGSINPVSGKHAEPCPENGESRVQNLDTNLVKEPVKEPLGAQVRERGNNFEIDQKKIELWLRKHHPAWPTYMADSPPQTLKAALSLTEQEREQAADRMGDYLAALSDIGRTKICRFSVYLSEKRWEMLPEKKAAPFNEYAPPFGPVWSFWVINHLLTAPRDGEKGWPLVSVLYKKALEKRGHLFAERWHRNTQMMEPVPVNGETWLHWQTAFERRGWPWIPDTGEQRVVYFPKGGPEALAAFEQAIKENEAV